MAVAQPVLLVGSVPEANAEAVFRTCGTALGDKVLALPDGETGQRRSWVTFLAATILDRHPHIHALNRPRPVGSIDNEWRTADEDWVPSSFDDMWSFEVEHDAAPIAIDTTGYARHAIESYAVFARLKAAGVIAPAVRFQVCLPLAESALRWFIADREGYERVRGAYEEALARDLRSILHAVPATELSIQWDVCMEVVAAALGDYTGRPPLAYRLDASPQARWCDALARMAASIPETVLMGLHLCYGDLGHVHKVEPEDLALSVEMANLGHRHAGRRVDYVHMAVPRNRTDAAYFAPLAGLDIGAATPYLGLVHHTDGTAGTRARISAAKAVLPEFGVATECGFGRRPAAQIAGLLQLHIDALQAL
ncbi:MAG: hypothetical protein AB7Q81_12675 [Gammaproteobacteria bacterium]